VVVLFACDAPPVPRAPLESDSRVRETRGLRYALPTCPLGYEVLVREKSYDGDNPQFDIERFMTIEATAKNGRMELAAVVVGRSLHDGVRSPSKPSADYAPPLLETDGLSWTERDGPTWLFSDVGAQGGLAWFFPTIPASLDRNAMCEWNVPRASSQSTASLRVEATRGHIPGLAERWQQHVASGAKDVERPPTLTPAEIRFAESHLEGGVRVSTLGMTAERRFESNAGEPFASTTVTNYRGTYAVTAGGRILRADIEAKEVMSTATQRLREDTDAKMHLVRACDGPVMPSIAPVLTPEESAEPVDDGPRFELPPPPKKKKP